MVGLTSSSALNKVGLFVAVGSLEQFNFEFEGLLRYILGPSNQLNALNIGGDVPTTVSAALGTLFADAPTLNQEFAVRWATMYDRDFRFRSSSGLE